MQWKGSTLMDIYEEAVLYYITNKQQRFINPQYNLAYNKVDNTGGSLPDFVVLDFQDKIIYIVEVSRAYNLKSLLIKVSQRNERWIIPIKNSLDKSLCQWKFHTTLFIRDDRIENTKKCLLKEVDVSIISLKSIDSFLGDCNFEDTYELINHNKCALAF